MLFLDTITVRCIHVWLLLCCVSVMTHSKAFNRGNWQAHTHTSRFVARSQLPPPPPQKKYLVPKIVAGYMPAHVAAVFMQSSLTRTEIQYRLDTAFTRRVVYALLCPGAKHQVHVCGGCTYIWVWSSLSVQRLATSGDEWVALKLIQAAHILQGLQV